MFETLLDAPVHGGDVRAASLRYGIPIENWLDLSTGINPDAYPIPSIPDACFQHLPSEYDSDLIVAAKRYYGAANLVVAAGSQRFIELLPSLRAHSRVAIPDVGYQEHHYHWQRCGHSIVLYNGWQPELLTQKIVDGEVDVVVLINPCNPTAAKVDIKTLLHWYQLLADRGGWLIIDEAFADVLPAYSFANSSHLPGVIVLRSLGKFFGLAGIRVGFALAAEGLVADMEKTLGPWSVSGPSQYVATKALLDTQWQERTQAKLLRNSQWMQAMLHDWLQDVVEDISSATLFIRVITSDATAKVLYAKLAEQGILVRLWSLPATKNNKAVLRFGLLGEDDCVARQRFQSALAAIKVD